MKEKIVRDAERLLDAAFGDVVDRMGSCLYWSVAVIVAAARHGRRLIPQAGSAHFRRLPPSLDDGRPETPTHFSYVWSGPTLPASMRSQAMLAAVDGVLILPEIHVWAADPQRCEIVDLTTRHLPDMCRRIGGLDWLDAQPPPYVWASSDRLPEGWVYRPDRGATQFAVRVAYTHVLPLLRA